MGVVRVRRPVLEFYTRDVKSPQRLMLETSNFVHGSAMRSLSFVISGCSLSGRGQGPVSNFYIADLENFATAITIRYDTRCYFNVRSKADISQLNLPHETDN